MPGDEVQLPAGGDTVEIRVRVQSINPLETLRLVWNGDIIEEVPLDKSRSNFSFTRSVPVTKSGWFHVRVAGNPRDRYPLDTGFAQAFTNPVWVIVDDQPVRSRPAANYGIRWIDKLHQMAEEWPGWRSQQERDHVFSQFDEARKIYERFAEEAKQ